MKQVIVVHMVGWWAQRDAREKQEHYIVDVLFLVKLKKKNET